MRTEDDLRAAIDRAAQKAPNAHELLNTMNFRPERDRPGTDPSRRRYLLPAVAAAAVVVLAAALTTVSLREDHDYQPLQRTFQDGAGPSVAHPCATGGQPDFTGITMRHIEGIAAVSINEQSCSGLSSRALQTSTGQEAGQVEVFTAGVFDTRKLEGASRVSGSGITGYLLPRGSTAILDIGNIDFKGTVECVRASDHLVPPTSVNASGRARSKSRSAGASGSATNTEPCDPGVSLAWKYATNSWAVISIPTSEHRQEDVQRLLSLASAVDTVHPAPVRMPFTADSLPNTVRIVDTDFISTAGGKLISTSVGLGETGRPDCPANTACSSFGEIGVLPNSNRASNHTGQPVDINNHTGYLNDQGDQSVDITVNFDVSPWHAYVGEAAATPRLADSTLTAIARSLHFASSVTDHTTWFNLNTAFGR